MAHRSSPAAALRQFMASIVEHEPLTPAVRRLVLKPPSGFDADSVVPGRFFLIQVSDAADPFLPRPFSVCDLHRSADETPLLEFTYRVQGRGTSLLASRRVGETLRVLGPLGHGFDPGPADAWHLIIAGGIGAAPFPRLVRHLTQREARTMYLVGGRTAADVLFIDRMKTLGARTMTATDDGSLGARGTVLGLLEQFLENPPQDGGALSIYACGPDPMLRAVAAFLRRHGHDAQLSLEARMACGVGACQGCVVETAAGGGAPVYKRVCVDGPVFRLSELFGDGSL